MLKRCPDDVHGGATDRWPHVVTPGACGEVQVEFHCEVALCEPTAKCRHQENQRGCVALISRSS
eukprot:937007-Amphidinium_carterae.1